MSGVYPPGPVERGASISGDGLYRYSLLRAWGPGQFVTFVMLNPSTADAELDDPTIRRCVSFTQSLGFNSLRVVNLYAFRATKPADLWLAEDPTGGDRNDAVLQEVGMVAKSSNPGPLIAAWGANARPDRVAEVLRFPGWDRLQALGVTKAGAPRHPLYLPASARPSPWPGKTAKREHAPGCPGAPDLQRMRGSYPPACTCPRDEHGLKPGEMIIDGSVHPCWGCSTSCGNCL